MATKIRGKSQIMDNTVDLGRLEEAFLSSSTGDWNITNGNNDATITGLKAPVNDGDVAIKSYVDSVAAGLDWKDSCQHATLSDVGGVYTSTGGSVGTGAFTGVDTTSTGGIFDIDTDEVAVDDRILVKDQNDPKQNGIYLVTSTGAAGGLVRATDHDGEPGSEVSAGNSTFVEHGTTYGQTGWVITGSGELTLNTDDINWTQFSGTGTYTAGDGLDLSGNEFSVDVTDIVGTGLEDDGSNNIRIAASAAGNGLTGGGGSALAVNPGDGIDITGDAVTVDVTDIIDTASGLTETGNDIQVNLESDGAIAFDGVNGGLEVQVDDSTIEISSNQLQVKADGINDTHIDWGEGANQVSASDIPLDTSTGTYGGVATNVQDALEELESSIPGSQNVFTTMHGTSGTDPVADNATDTLNFASASGVIEIAGNSGTDTLDFDVNADSINDTHIDWGSGANQVNATDMPIDSGGTYGGAAANVQDALEEIEAANLQFKTFVPTAGTNVVADSSSDTLTITSDNTTIVVTGDGANDELDFDIAIDGVDETHIDWGSGANQVDATSVPIDSGGTWGGSATNVQDALEELESDANADYKFRTIHPSSGEDVVAEAVADTLNITGSGPVVVTGTAVSDTITLSIGTDTINDTHIDWGTGANQVNAGDIPIIDSGTYFGTDFVEDALQDLGAEVLGYTRVYGERQTPTHNTNTFTLNNTPVRSGSERIYKNGQRANVTDDYSINYTTGLVTWGENFLNVPGQQDVVVIDYQY